MHHRVVRYGGSSSVAGKDGTVSSKVKAIGSCFESQLTFC